MTKKTSRTKPQPYKIWMRPEVHSARGRLPGHVRQRIKRTIESLSTNPRPPRSRTLRLSDIIETSVDPEWEVRRIRLDNWRIVYAVNDMWREIGILTIQKRPPYDYGDLERLISDL